MAFTPKHQPTRLRFMPRGEVSAAFHSHPGYSYHRAFPLWAIVVLAIVGFIIIVIVIAVATCWGSRVQRLNRRHIMDYMYFRQRGAGDAGTYSASAPVTAVPEAPLTMRAQVPTPAPRAVPVRAPAPAPGLAQAQPTPRPDNESSNGPQGLGENPDLYGYYAPGAGVSTRNGEESASNRELRGYYAPKWA